MKFTLNWLKEYIDTELSAGELAERLTMLGLEVDSVCDLHTELDGIVVGEVLHVANHPDADRLTVCRVAVGDEEKQVVCGAPNVRVGMKVALALPGTNLLSRLHIKEAKVRGVLSQGMMCSEKELGISENHAGIMELPGSVVSGRSLAEALELCDTLIEVDLTPNRPDCASVIGIAREVAGFSAGKLKLPVAAAAALTGVDLPFAVEVEDAAACPRYTARLLKNVTIAPSPWWIRKRLLAIGMRPINNVVDITNLVMMEFGQPLHAFDYKLLAGSRVVIRHARPGESIVTLDGEERQLDAEMLLICDAEKPVAVAGIMGGENSEVSATTTDILLESACFDPVSVRRTARRLNLATEASYRFERGVDPGGTHLALERAVELMTAVTGGDAVPDGIDFRAGVIPRPPITLRVGRVSALLGVQFSAATITRYLEAIEIGVTQQDEETLIVHPPTFRIDLEREIDLVEEVARLEGYDDIPSTLPGVPMSFPEQDEGRRLRSRVAAILTASGFYEAINYSFVSRLHFDQLGLADDDPARRTVNLLNPLSDEQAVMRTILLPGLLENVRRNINHQNGDLRFFEIGKVFIPRDGGEQPLERVHLAGILSGRRFPGAPVFHAGVEPVDIFDVKGTVETLIRELELQGVEVRVGDDSRLPPYGEKGFGGIINTADGIQLGHFGRVKAGVLKNFDIKQPLFFFDLDMDGLARQPMVAKKHAPLPRFPTVNRDIALLVPVETAAGDMLAAIRGAGEKLLEAAEIFDVYRGNSIEAGFKSVAISVTYRSAEKTLKDEVVNKVHQKLISMLESRFQGRMREV